MKKIYIETFNDNQFKYREESDPDFQVRPKNYKLVKEVDYDAQSFKLNLIDCFTKETLFRGKSVDAIYVDGSNYTDIDSLNDAISPLIFKKGGGSGGGGADLTLEQARQNGNVLEGAVKFSEENNTYLYGDGYSIEIGTEKDSSSQYFYLNDSISGFNVNIGGYEYILVLDINNSCVDISSNDPSFKGISSSQEFDKQGDRKAFAQIADIEDRLAQNSTELISADYGTTTNILKSTQFFTTGDGTGLTTVTLDPSIPIGSLLFVSDWGNEAEMNNIVVDAGTGNIIMKGDGTAVSQTMIIDSSGLSYTLRKLTANNWMVIGTNQ